MNSADIRFFACRQQIWWQEFIGDIARTKTTKNESSANVRYEAQLWQMADRNSDGLDAEMRKHLTAEDKRGELHADERCFSGIWA